MDEAADAEQRRTIGIALTLKATMFVVGGIAGLVAQSSGLLADALDMFADASAYAITTIEESSHEESLGACNV